MMIRKPQAWLGLLCLPFLLNACASGAARQQESLRTEDEIVAPLRAEIARKNAEIERLQYSIEILGRDLEELRGEIARLQAPVQVTPVAETPADPVAEAPPAPATPPAGDFAIHLASYGSPESAAAGWRQIARNHPDLLADLEPRYTVLEVDGGPYYRLIAGRFAAREDAAGVCDRLAPANGYCVVTFFGGDALP